MNTPEVVPSAEDPLRAIERIEASLKQTKGKKHRHDDRAKDVKSGSVRGIETMFRTTLQSHDALVGLADNKANMMISVNGLIISITLASFDQVGWMYVPYVVLILGSLSSMIFGLLAAMPRVTRNPITIEDVRSGRANLLFFGNFLTLPMEDYLEGMRVLIEQPDQAYMNMIRNLYALGHILERKFRLLTYSYSCFLAGLTGAVVLFLTLFVRMGGLRPIVLP